jgi:hypothetical protein
MKSIAILVVITTLTTSTVFARQVPQPDVWRTFAQQIDIGSRLIIRLDDGGRLTATLIQADADGMLVQPRTRVPVPAQRVAYDRITSIERDDPRGISVGKAVVLGVASGVGAFFGTLLILMATLD